MPFLTTTQAQRLLFIWDELDRLDNLEKQTSLTKALQQELHKEVREILPPAEGSKP